MARDLDDRENERAESGLVDADPEAEHKRTQAEQLQVEFRAANESGKSVVDELLSERRAEAEREEQYDALAAPRTDDDIRISRGMRDRRDRQSGHAKPDRSGDK